MIAKEDKVIGIKAGVPDTLLPGNSINYVYSTTVFVMLRGIYDST